MRTWIVFLLITAVLVACKPTSPATPTVSAVSAGQPVQPLVASPIPTSVRLTETPVIPTAVPTEASVSVAQGTETAVVTRVIDGDTIEVRIGEIGFRVRYIGVNTTERGETCYGEGRAANAALVEGKTVQLVRDTSNTDRYGRLLRYVYVDGVFVNAQLVADGWAEAVRYPPDTRHAAEYEALQAEARQANIGCYALGVWGGTRAGMTATPLPPPPTATQAKLTYYVNSAQNINVRSEASTSANILGSLAPAASVEILGEVEGAFVLGSANWYEIDYNGQTGYVHSSLLSDTPISTRPPQPVQPQPVQQQPAQPQQPVQQEQPVAQPTQPPPPPPAPAAPAFSCDCSKTCPAMLSCEEAYFQLNTCGCGRRDGDSDGVPCEDICPGG